MASVGAAVEARCGPSRFEWEATPVSCRGSGTGAPRINRRRAYRTSAHALTGRGRRGLWRRGWFAVVVAIIQELVCAPLDRCRLPVPRRSRLPRGLTGSPQQQPAVEQPARSRGRALFQLGGVATRCGARGRRLRAGFDLLGPVAEEGELTKPSACTCQQSARSDLVAELGAPSAPVLSCGSRVADLNRGVPRNTHLNESCFPPPLRPTTGIPSCPLASRATTSPYG